MMDKETYSQYLNSAEWKDKAEKVRERDSNVCWICGSIGNHYHVHHLSYERVTREEMKDLITVCPSCHEAIHTALNDHMEEAKRLKSDYNKEVAERIKDIDTEYVSRRADVIARTVMQAVGKQKTKNINAIVSYFEDALKLDSSMHRQLGFRKIPIAYTLATQRVAKLRKKKKAVNE